MKKILLVCFMLVSFTSGYVMAQDRTVSGKVTSAEDGSPLPGVNVIVKGTGQGTTTDIDGNYKLNVPSDGATLQFSFIGMQNKEEAIGARSVVDVTMLSDVTQLSEVIVTGYTKETRDKLSGSIGTVSSQAIDQVPMPSFDQILQGRTPGLYVTSGSGQPGAGATVRIRGSGSINASSEPLYIMDGVPINSQEFATINPNDFENVSVLKDASATALYGSRGANGVIVITTKKGKTGAARVNYRFQTGWSQQARENFEMMNSEEKLMFESWVGTGPGGNLDPNDPDDAAELARLRGINTDWRDVFIRTGRTTSHELNVSGGNESTNYYVSFNYLNQEGQALRSGLERYTTRFNLTSNLSDKLIIGVNSSIGFSKSGLIESENAVALANPFAAVYLANPYEELFDPETGDINFGTGRIGANAYDRIINSTNDRNELKGVMSAYVEYNILDGLTAKAQVGVDYRQRDFERWIDPTSFAGSTTQPGGSGLLSNAFNRRLQWVNTNTLAYSKKIQEVHDFDVIVGTEALQRTFNSFNFTGYGLNDKLPLSNQGITTGPQTIPVVGGSWSGNSLFSLFSILNYTYDSKYNFRGTLRRDGSSRFGEENQWALLWSVAGSWNLHKEDFMSSASFVNELKLRASYGRTGNQEFTPENSGDFRSLTTYAATSYAGLAGLAPATVGDPGYRWEISNQLNLGVDFALFETRLNGTVEVYNNITDDLFITQQLSRTTGFTSRQVNAGQMRNRGIEVLLNYDLVRTRDFRWAIGGNFTYNQNEILDLGQVDEFEQGTSIIRVGLPLGSHYVVEWAGVNPANGQPLYKDADGNITPVFSQDNSVANFGTWQPPVWGGFNTDISYKGFSASAFFTYNYGMTIFNNQRFFQENHNFTQYNLSRIMLDMWREPGDVTDIQSFRYPREFSSKDLEDGSFLRLRNVIVSYTLPKTLLDRVNTISNVRVYAQGQNLFTWTKFTGFDPENFNNIAQYEYPASKIYTLGLDVTF